jgi:hypothetical protein
VETTPAPTLECPDESWELVTLQLAPQDDAAQCLRTEPEERVSVPFCVDVTSSSYLRGFCDDTGRKYVVLIRESFIAPPGFSLCDPPGGFYERPCYTTCDELTLGSPWLETLCGEEETHVAAGCGELDSAYDENCCKRPFCYDGDCPSGMSCEWLMLQDAVIGQQSGECQATFQSDMPTPHCVPIP